MQKPKIYIDENIPLLADSIGNQAEINRFSGRLLKNKQLFRTGCDALIVRSTTKVNEELLKNIDIKLVGTATSGSDHIDIEYLNNRGINLSIAVGCNANSVAEYVIYNILNTDYKNKTIGIIGYGNIGKLVAEYSKRIGLKVFVNDSPLFDNSFIFPDYTEYKDLSNLLKESDIITNHVPLTLEGKYKTKDLLNRSNLDLINPESMVIHTSRGGVINENDLISVPNKLVIDVWEKEPDFNSELAKKAGFATPHIAGYSYNGKINGSKMMAEALNKYLNIEIDWNLFEIEKNANELNWESYHLQNYIEISREFDSDLKKFNEIIDIPTEEKKIEFDKLRKYYPKRKEFLFL